MLVIRLQRRGKRNQPFFWIVLAEKTAPVKGKYIEKLGYLNPLKKEVAVDGERVKHWLSKGVDVSDTVYNILVEKNIIEGEKRKIKIKPKKKKKEEKAEGEKTQVSAEKEEKANTQETKEESQKANQEESQNNK